jgi:hypothetical protein
MAIGASLLAVDPAEDTRLLLMVAFEKWHPTITSILVVCKGC